MSKILIIEDDPLIIKMYKLVFQMENFEVDTASDGLEGLAKVNQFNPEMILLDIMMPKMNGYEVLGKLKADPSTSAIPVILLTNFANQKGNLDEILNKYHVKYIMKSEFDPIQVVDLVKKELEEYNKR